MPIEKIASMCSYFAPLPLGNSIKRIVNIAQFPCFHDNSPTGRIFDMDLRIIISQCKERPKFETSEGSRLEKSKHIDTHNSYLHY